MNSTDYDYDVVIVGGGPVGSTVSSLLKKHNPDLSVLVVEKERFPRDHVGESLLPSVCPILDEMGVWDKVEAAGFPIKIGASYTWGANADQWDIDFYPVQKWKDEARPAKFQGQRKYSAFQVDRAIYDNILLEHAESMGVTVRQGVQVNQIKTRGDRIEGFVLDTGETVTGRYYIDGSGAPAILRKALGIESDAPEALRNIAIWDYWENAKWALEIGVGATRVQVRSLSYGWIWFIPLGPSRTSVGLICPSEYYKASGKSPAELYAQAIAEQPEIASLCEQGTPSGDVQSCKDWSHLARKLVGENWFICGEAGGFADPILAAGLSLAHSSSREAVYSILELDRGELDAQWIKDRYQDRNATNISQHIRFAQFWYSANGCFTDLQEHCQSIAKEAGLRLSPSQAWRWLSQGGFTTEQVGLATFGSFDIASAKQVIELFDVKGRSCQVLVDGHNVFKLNLYGATKDHVGELRAGRIEQTPCFVRGSSRLPLAGNYQIVVEALEHSSDFVELARYINRRLELSVPPEHRGRAFDACIQALEVLCQEDWVQRGVNKKRPMLHASNKESQYIRASEQTLKVLAEAEDGPTFKSNI